MVRFPKLFLYLVLVFFLLFTFTGCAQNIVLNQVKDNAQPTTKDRVDKSLQQSALVNVRLYYKSIEGDYLVPVTYAFNLNTSALCRLAIEKLLAGTGKNLPLQGVLPEGTKLRNISLNDDQTIAYVDFTKEFKKINNSNQLHLAIDAVTLTLSDAMPGLQGVQFLVEGRPLSAFLGEDLSLPQPRPQINLQEKEKAQNPVLVYFKDKASSLMVPFTYEANGKNTPEEKMDFALQKLIIGPPSSSLEIAFPDASRILSLSFEPLEETVAVDFNAATLNYLENNTQEEAFLNSILYTLGSFEGVKKVEILIEGEKLVLLPSGLTLPSPLEVPKNLNFVSVE